MVTPEHHVALVDRLVQYSQPVRRIWPVGVRWTLILAFWSAAGAMLTWRWPRPDLATKLHEPWFTLGLAALALATALTTLLALRSAVPGRAPSRSETGLALILVGTATLSFCHHTATQSSVTGWACALRTLAAAALPWGVLLVVIRRGAPVGATSAGVLSAAAALLFATTVLRTACPNDDSLHWLTWHLGTVAFATALSTPLATSWLRTWRHG